MLNLEVDPKIKKGLNEEGFESEAPDSGAAVLVGKKEEMPQLPEKLEKEGKAVDLASYIRLHKVIRVPEEEINPEVKSRVEKGMGWLVNMIDYKGKMAPEGTDFNLFFIDSDGNIARTRIRSRLIDDKSFMPPKEHIEEYLKLSNEFHKVFKDEQQRNEISNRMRISEVPILRKIKSELEALGFNISGDSDGKLFSDILNQISSYDDRIKNQLKENKNREFNF